MKIIMKDRHEGSSKVVGDETGKCHRKQKSNETTIEIKLEDILQKAGTPYKTTLGAVQRGLAHTTPIPEVSMLSLFRVWMITLMAWWERSDLSQWTSSASIGGLPTSWGRKLVTLRISRFVARTAKSIYALCKNVPLISRTSLQMETNDVELSATRSDHIILLCLSFHSELL